MSEESADRVKITVRPAFQTSGGDLQVECPRLWTVRRLKEHLHDVCPTHPEVSAQRLIYAGACLTDSTSLEAVLSRVGVTGPQVFHLACPMPAANNPQNPDLRQRRPVTSSSNSTSTISSDSSASQANNAFSPDTMAVFWQQYYGSNLSASGMSPQQQAAYNAYYTYYMNQYMAHYGAAGAAAAAVTTGQIPVVAANVNLGGAGVGAAPQAPAAGGAVAAAAPVAVGAAAVQDPAERVDLFEMVYRGFRICIFVVFILLYASIEKAMQVIAIALVLYFIQMIRNPQQQAAVQRRDQQRAAVQEGAEVNNNAAGEEGVEPAMEAADFVHPDEARGGTLGIFFSTCYSFLTSFITSLVPDNPVPVNVN